MSFHPKRSSSSSESEENDDEAKKRYSKLGEVSIASDDSTSAEELAVENRALSPATRLSISGIRPDDLSSDEDEIIVGKKATRNVLISDDEDEEAESEEELVAKDNEHDSFDESLPMHSYNAESGKRDSISTKLSSTAVSEETDDLHEKSMGKRLSSSIRQSIGTKLSSTVVEENGETSEYQDRSHSPSIVEVQKSNEILLLSSDDEDNAKVDKPALIQPTIKSIFPAKQVSQSFYDSKMRKLADMKATLVSMEKLTRVRNDLPDKGVALMKRMNALKQEITTLNKEIDQMEVNESNNIRNEIQKSFESSIDSSRNNSLAR